MNKTTVLVGIVAGFTGGACYNSFISSSLWSKTNEKTDSNDIQPRVRISYNHETKYRSAIKKSRELVKRFKDQIGAPGLVIGVSVDGNIIWEEGFGYANLETRTPCNVDTAMRIASISKPITIALLAKLWEQKKIDLDKSVYDYISYFPKKTVDGENVDITVRQLASHTAGVRHYRKKDEPKKSTRDYGQEFYFKDNIDSIEKSVEMFKNDELLFKPGSSFEYTTHGYTLISGIIENAGGKPFTEQIENLFNILGLKNTHLDRVKKIVYERASYYDKDDHGRVVNAQLADTSYKWAGGGLISTVGDLLKFGDIMLYCYQQGADDKPGFLKKETVTEMWTPVKNTVMKWANNAGYGLGWTVVPESTNAEDGLEKFHVGHAGGAVGASSVLIILPREGIAQDENNNKLKKKLPQGVSVAILANLEDISCRTLAKNVAEEFNKI